MDDLKKDIVCAILQGGFTISNERLKGVIASNDLIGANAPEKALAIVVHALADQIIRLDKNSQS